MRQLPLAIHVVHRAEPVLCLHRADLPAAELLVLHRVNVITEKDFRLSAHHLEGLRGLLERITNHASLPVRSWRAWTWYRGTGSSNRFTIPGLPASPASSSPRRRRDSRDRRRAAHGRSRPGQGSEGIGVVRADRAVEDLYAEERLDEAPENSSSVLRPSGEGVEMMAVVVLIANRQLDRCQILTTDAANQQPRRHGQTGPLLNRRSDGRRLLARIAHF